MPIHRKSDVSLIVVALLTSGVISAPFLYRCNVVPERLTVTCSHVLGDTAGPFPTKKHDTSSLHKLYPSAMLRTSCRPPLPFVKKVSLSVMERSLYQSE